MEQSIQLSKTQIDDYFKNHYHKRGKDRLGQHFHQHFKLDKITSGPNLAICQKLYNSDTEQALNVIESITDYNN